MKNEIEKLEKALENHNPIEALKIVRQLMWYEHFGNATLVFSSDSMAKHFYYSMRECLTRADYIEEKHGKEMTKDFIHTMKETLRISMVLKEIET